MTDPDELWWAYFAGILVGEGCITIDTDASPRASIQVKMTDKEAVLHLAGKLGSTAYRRRPSGPRCKAAWVVRVSRMDVVQRCLEHCLPYLCGVKQQQAQLTLEFLACKARKTAAKTPKEATQALLEMWQLARQIRSLSLGANKAWKARFSRKILRLRKELANAKMQGM